MRIPTLGLALGVGLRLLCGPGRVTTRDIYGDDLMRKQ